MIKFVVKSFFERARACACACVPGRARPLRLGGSSFRSCFRRMGFIRLLMGPTAVKGEGRRGSLLLALAMMVRSRRPRKGYWRRVGSDRENDE